MNMRSALSVRAITFEFRLGGVTESRLGLFPRSKAGCRFEPSSRIE